MAKRKINVDKLSEEQLSLAEKKISERVNGAIKELHDKWNPKLKKYGIDTQLEVVVQPESSLEVTEKTHGDFFNAYLNDEKLGVLAQDLNQISAEMTQDINDKIKHCNTLLSRYGMLCDMAFVSKD
jgi:hypothetical protein